MRPVSNKAAEAIEEVAIEGAKQLKAFFAYQGDNRKYFDKARLGCVAISAYSRVIATETNREALRLAAERSISVPLIDKK